MERIIGIDYGRKRIGLAVSDPLRIFASALETVQSAKIIDYLKIIPPARPLSGSLSDIRSIWTASRQSSCRRGCFPETARQSLSGRTGNA